MKTKDETRKPLPDALARRLPAYYRYVCAMEAEGIKIISSSELAARVGNSSSQVRQDFFTCGGVNGYHTDVMKAWLQNTIGISEMHHVVVVGAGNLGRAIVSFSDFNQDGFFVDAVFDSNLMYHSMQICGIPIMNVLDLESYLNANQIDMIVITTPASAAPELLKIAEKCGVEGIWNFAPVDLRSDIVTVQNVHLSDSLLTLSFRMTEKKLKNN